MPEQARVRAPSMSFIVRVWTDGEGESQLRGEIEHVGTGEKRFFPNYRALLALIETWRQDANLVG